MSLAITILTTAGTLANGHDRLVSTSFSVSPVRSFTRDIAEFLGCEAELAELDQGEIAAIEIDPAGLLSLTIMPHLNMINGGCFDATSSGVDALAKAQKAARAPGARVMIESSL